MYGVAHYEPARKSAAAPVRPTQPALSLCIAPVPPAQAGRPDATAADVTVLCILLLRGGLPVRIVYYTYCIVLCIKYVLCIVRP